MNVEKIIDLLLHNIVVLLLLHITKVPNSNFFLVVRSHKTLLSPQANSRTAS